MQFVLVKHFIVLYDPFLKGLDLLDILLHFIVNNLFPHFNYLLLYSFLLIEVFINHSNFIIPFL
jgi:hypothetical protein